jgi:hypothetical protein
VAAALFGLPPPLSLSCDASPRHTLPPLQPHLHPPPPHPTTANAASWRTDPLPSDPLDLPLDAYTSPRQLSPLARTPSTSFRTKHAHGPHRAHHAPSPAQLLASTAATLAAETAAINQPAQPAALAAAALATAAKTIADAPAQPAAPHHTWAHRARRAPPPPPAMPPTGAVRLPSPAQTSSAWESSLLPYLQPPSPRGPYSTTLPLSRRLRSTGASSPV